VYLKNLAKKWKTFYILTLTLVEVARGSASFDVNIRKHTVILRSVLSRSRLNCYQNKRLAFPNSADFLPARLASVISLSFSKTGALGVSASLIAILELGILSSPASFSCSRTDAYPSGPPFMNSVYGGAISNLPGFRRVYGFSILVNYIPYLLHQQA